MMSEEQLILVDERNRATGSGSKTAIHRKGLLHRAFSIFMRAKCRHISYLDYSVRLGHREQLTIDDKGLVTKASQSQDHWPSTVAEAFESQGMGVAPKE